MNEELTEVLLEPTQEQLDSAASPDSIINLFFEAAAPCRLYTVFLDSDSWDLEQITICRRWLVWSKHNWGVGAVLLPGQTLEVEIRNKCWVPGLLRPNVELELYVEAVRKFTEKKREGGQQRAREAFMRKLQERNKPDLPQVKFAEWPKPVASPPPPRPEPTRFSELDIEDDE